ncbi:MAG TPA: RICIN domain-containing protein [Pyrinomonadaceae bacterium]
MATSKLTPPVVIAWTGPGLTNMCMQAAYSGVDAQITLAPIQWDPPAGQSSQLWQFGDDRRIYVYTADNPGQFCLDFPNPPQNGQPLTLNDVIASDQTQMWDWNSHPQTLANVGAPGFYADDDGGGRNPGTKIQIWTGTGSGNANQVWTPLLMPTYYLNSQTATQAAGS